MVMYWDHDYEGNQVEPCKYPVLRYNRDFQHAIDDSWCTRCDLAVVRTVLSYYEGYPNAWQESCGCDWTKLDENDYLSNYWVCVIDRKPSRDPIHNSRVEVPCGADVNSVLHRPDQFRHWCGILEAGGDCMHGEMDGY